MFYSCRIFLDYFLQKWSPRQQFRSGQWHKISNVAPTSRTDTQKASVDWKSYSWPPSFQKQATFPNTLECMHQGPGKGMKPCSSICLVPLYPLLLDVPANWVFCHRTALFSGCRSSQAPKPPFVFLGFWITIAQKVKKQGGLSMNLVWKLASSHLPQVSEGRTCIKVLFGQSDPTSISCLHTAFTYWNFVT